MKQSSGMADEEFVSWVAGLKMSDQIPGEYRTGWRGEADFTPLINRLVDLGVMDKPSPSDLVVAVMDRAISAAKGWEAARTQT